MMAHMTNNTVTWVHGDCLSPYGPTLTAYPDAPAVWVWDEELLAAWRISLKRIVFMYECLLELPVVLRRGEMAAEIATFAREHGATTVATAGSPSPRFTQICRRLEAEGFQVEVHPVAPFLAEEADFDLKRFSRYWRKAKKLAFDPTGTA